jgi:hypothetical protein
MGWFSKKLRIVAGAPGGPEGSDSEFQVSDQGGPNTGIPIGTFAGYQPVGFHVTLPGAYSYQVDPSPVTVARYNMSRGVHDVQLSNGWQRTNYGKRTTYASSGYLSGIVPQVPGQSRLIGQGGSPGNFTPKTQSAIAPVTWQNNVAQAQAQAVNTISGPGTIGGTLGTGFGASGG